MSSLAPAPAGAFFLGTALMSLDKIIAPIPGPSPTGDDLTFSPEFDRITEARRADDPTLAQGEWTRPLKSADWPLVLRLTQSLLADRTKDLRVVVWYAEARTSLDGFAGLADGLEATAQLCEAFWDGLHPSGDDEERAGCLRRLVSLAQQWVRTTPLGAGTDACLSTLLVSHGARADTAAENLRNWRALNNETALAGLRTAVERVHHALSQLDAVMLDKLGEEAPSIAGVSSGVTDILNLLGSAAIEQPTATPVEAPTHVAPAPTPVAYAGSSPYASRAEAIQALRHVASFFRTTEPHSPVAYLAERAANWGEMSLHVWLHSVLGEGESLKQLQTLLDMPPA